MDAQYNDVQLDALRELANIGAGTASTALSTLLGRVIDLSVPDVRVLPLAESVDALGAPEQEVTGIALGVIGDLDASLLILLTPRDVEGVCALLGVEPGSELVLSMLGEIGNVVAASYLNALAGMAGMELEPTPPTTLTDMLGAIVASILATRAAVSDRTLLLDSNLSVEGEACSFVFLLVPDHGGAEQLLERLGVS